MGVDRMDFDLIVIGAGLAGLSAAARAAEAGLRVAVIEAARTHGGSSAISGAYLWTVESPHKIAYHAEGQPGLAELVADGYAEGVRWLRGRGVAFSRALNPLNGRGYQIDMLGHLAACIRTVEQAGGSIAYETRVVRLVADGSGRVVGAATSHADGDVELRAPWTLLATGGYQGSPDMREAYLGPNGRHMLLRSNLVSDGAGIRLATAAGAAAPVGNTGFYGHLVSESPQWGDRSLFGRLSQYHSDHSVLINTLGRRFTDETLGDHVNAHRTLQQPGGRALMVTDSVIHGAHGVRPVVELAPAEDRMAVALQHGGVGAIVDSLEEVWRFAAGAGFDGGQALRTLRAYNETARDGWEQLDPPRTLCEHQPLDTAPFYALVVHPAITFSFAGVRVDDRMRALDSRGQAVGGLLVAGADVGDLYRIGYGGGLAAALATGLRAAATLLTA